MSLGCGGAGCSTFTILLHSANYKGNISFFGGEILETFYVLLNCLETRIYMCLAQECFGIPVKNQGSVFSWSFPGSMAAADIGMWGFSLRAKAVVMGLGGQCVPLERLRIFLKAACGSEGRESTG